MSSIGFINNNVALAVNGYDVSAISVDELPWTWDRQTIVLLCANREIMNDVQETLRSSRKPNSSQYSDHYNIDGFVNLNYSIHEKDPANRNVRIVYCDMERMTKDEVYRRFQCSYMIRVGRSESNGTPRIGRGILKIFGK